MRIFYDFRKGPKHWLKEFARIKKDPLQIALGFALGLFFSNLFTPGFSLIIILLLIALFKVNKFSAILGYAINLPIFIPLNYYYSYKIGSFLMGETTEISLGGIGLSLVKSHLPRFILGNFVLSLGLGLVSFGMVYLVSKYIVKTKLKKKKPQKTL